MFPNTVRAKISRTMVVGYIFTPNHNERKVILYDRIHLVSLANISVSKLN